MFEKLKNLMTLKMGKENRPDIEVFTQNINSVKNWWKYFGGKPNLEGLKILEIGCGWGSLCIDAGLSKAKKVVGLDISNRLITFCNENLKDNYPELMGKVEFYPYSIKILNDYEFDFILSKNTFEHVSNLGEEVIEIKKRLKIGGYIYSSFGPLFFSPFGDHRRFHRALNESGINIPHIFFPWSHLVIPEPLLIKIVNHYRGDNKKIKSLYNGINKLTLKEYRDLVKTSGLEIITFQVKKIGTNKTLLKFLGNSFLEEYLSCSITLVLKKT